eukprot:TRINITY_DN120236_c1_g1_i1.p2 TRINITY_DN120236_c1_g1~~TRINITY_DN120236_c1_g1_i1.p2  ORF type:complete len:265 (-),score=29.19 TRINITY_DN120236_c1_g1_i1:1961-2665(-)
MKFKFCGNHECPEWVLSEIVVLSKISAIRLRMLASYILSKIKGLPYDLAKIEKLCLDSGMTPDETHSALAVLEFVIRGAAKHQVEEAELMKEIEQLGLPHENTESIIKTMGKGREGLLSAIKNSALRVSKPTGVDYMISFVVGTDRKKVTEGTVLDTEIKLKLSYNDGIEKSQKDTEFGIKRQQLGELIYELKKCEDLISKLEIQQSGQRCFTYQVVYETENMPLHTFIMKPQE